MCLPSCAAIMWYQSGMSCHFENDDPHDMMLSASLYADLPGLPGCKVTTPYQAVQVDEEGKRGKGSRREGTQSRRQDTTPSEMLRPHWLDIHPGDGASNQTCIRHLAPRCSEMLWAFCDGRYADKSRLFRHRPLEFVLLLKQNRALSAWKSTQMTREVSIVEEPALRLFKPKVECPFSERSIRSRVLYVLIRLTRA